MSEIMNFTILQQIAVTLIGAVLIRLFLQVIKSVYFHFRSITNMPDIYGKKSWAVVTGATDGIGFGFCEELASLGFNICLISRNGDKLQ